MSTLKTSRNIPATLPAAGREAGGFPGCRGQRFERV